MASVHDLAAYILTAQGPMSAMKLQKLCYYSQAYSVAWFNETIFKEPIKAWTNGPVVPSLWQEHKGMFFVERNPKGNPSRLSARDKAVADAIMDSMGGLSGKQLSDRTHEEAPWQTRYDGDDDYPDGVITHDDLREFYGRKRSL